jgi:hypothetical protein
MTNSKVKRDATNHAKSQTDSLIELASKAELFHNPDGISFADIQVDGHRETWPVLGGEFSKWLTHSFFKSTTGAPNSQSMRAALNVIDAKAKYEGPEQPVHVRAGNLKGRYYLDLADDQWHVVEICKDGWRILDEPPIRFCRAPGMKAIPLPVQGGSIKMLRPYLNVASDNDFVLAVSWLLAALIDRGPYPVLMISGEQGSAKSTFCKILRLLIDPNAAPLRALPREERDLFIAASNSHIIAFDNVSSLQPWLSDTICRLASGGGFAVRQLDSDRGEILFNSSRPVLINGIEDCVVRSDLADRCIFLTLPPISDEERQTESKIVAKFESERCGILGVLLDSMVEGIRQLPSVLSEGLPRMADYALWIRACETALWEAGTFSLAYAANRETAVDGLIEADPVAYAVRLLMDERTVWTGTATQLLNDLSQKLSVRAPNAESWPKTPRALAGRLRRAATSLRKIGIEIDFSKEGRARTRVVRLKVNQSRA